MLAAGLLAPACLARAGVGEREESEMQTVARLGRDSPPATVPRCLIVSVNDGAEPVCRLLSHLRGSPAELIQSTATSRTYSTQIIAIPIVR